VVLAPGATAAAEAQPARRTAGWSWKAPAAVAAGFMAAAAALIVAQGWAPVGGGTPQILARTPGAATATSDPVFQVASPAGEPMTLVADRQLVRDARLQRYFAAHQQFDASSALGASSGFLRAATSRTSER
jgi:sigma-E factor negative regulatory protein RseA